MNETVLGIFLRFRSRAGGFLLVTSDYLALTCALVLSLWLRFDNLSLDSTVETYLLPNAISFVVALASYSVIFRAFRLYRYAWRFASLEVVCNVICANTIGVLAVFASHRILGEQPLPVSVFVVFWMMSIAFVGGVRILLRLASLGTNYGRGAFQWIKRDTRPRRAVVLGSGPAAARLLKALGDECDAQYDVLGMLDDSPDTKGKYILNTRVIGPLSSLHKLLEERAIDEVLIALEDVSGDKVREYALACRKKKVPVKVIPGLDEILNGNGRTHIEEISVEDLLRRAPVKINLDKIGGCITGARVLVTGAGGSIGSELCRQILRLNPATLFLLGHGENSIHDIYQELCRIAPDKSERLRMVVASVADEVRMDQVFRELRPQVIFHAAAHKHVPIMESNLIEAVQNNVIGTDCVAECCGRYGVEKMVLISTDKAVAPSSVMGATKWLCEEVVRAMVKAYPRTKFVAVRFGNVLGSRGSVVPIFHEAIRNGGPVLVTHPEMTRYFMSIPEAVQLVLQAGTSGESGELFLLDMGEPVKILDLACDMIRLCGYEPDVDIPIEFCGLRPGERLHEALTNDGEDLQRAACDGLFVVHRPSYFTELQVDEMLRRIQEIILSGDTPTMRELLEEHVPGFSTDVLFDQTAPKLKVGEG